MRLRGLALAILSGGAALVALALAAEAKPARCFTTDDGYFACDFRGLDKAGSFAVSAPGYPGYTLEVNQPGFAYGFVTIGGRSIPLPGRYGRSRDDGACWVNPETNTKICAW